MVHDRLQEHQEAPIFLQINSANPALGQMAYSPSSAAGLYTFVFSLDAELLDNNDTSLFNGPMTVGVNPSAVEPIHLMMLGRLLQPFSGVFEMGFDGSYTTPNGQMQVAVDAILSCNLQPG